jgi:dihydroorotase
VFPIGAVSKRLKGEELAEIGGMVSEGARAISDDGMPVMNSLLMRRAMEYACAFGIPVISHAEDFNLVNRGVMNEGVTSCCLGLRGNPSAAEEIMVAREIALSRLTGCPVHIAHVSAKESIAHIRRAKEEGLLVTAEVSPHHLALTEEVLASFDSRFKVAPPLRQLEDTKALKAALKEGVIDMIATDHAPHGLIDKQVDFDQAKPGMIGLQTAVSVTLESVWNKELSILRWLDALTVKPAKLLGIPQGTLKAGADADLVLFDPETRYTFQDDLVLSKSKNSPFSGRDCRGKALMTWVGGRLAYEAR